MAVYLPICDDLASPERDSNDPINGTQISMDGRGTFMELQMAPEMSETRTSAMSVLNKVRDVMVMGQATIRAGYVDQYVEGGTTEQEETIATSRTVGKSGTSSYGIIPAVDRSTDVWVSQDCLERTVSISTSKMLTAQAQSVNYRYWICQLKIDYNCYRRGFNPYPAGQFIPNDTEADDFYGVFIGEELHIPTCQNSIQYAILKSKEDIGLPVTTARIIFSSVAGIKFTTEDDGHGSEIPEVYEREAYWSVDNISGCTDWIAFMDHSMFPKEHERIVSTQGAEAWGKILFDRLKPWNVKRFPVPTLPGLTEIMAAKINNHTSSLIDAQRQAMVGEWKEENAWPGKSKVGPEKILAKLHAVPDEFIADVGERLSTNNNSH